MREIRLSSSPALEERGDSLRGSVFKLFLKLGVEEFAIRVQNGESRHTLADRYTVPVRDVHVMVDVADVDVNHDVVLGEELGIGCLMVHRETRVTRKRGRDLLFPSPTRVCWLFGVDRINLPGTDLRPPEHTYVDRSFRATELSRAPRATRSK